MASPTGQIMFLKSKYIKTDSIPSPTFSLLLLDNLKRFSEEEVEVDGEGDDGDVVGNKLADDIVDWSPIDDFLKVLLALMLDIDAWVIEGEEF